MEEVGPAWVLVLEMASAMVQELVRDMDQEMAPAWALALEQALVV